MLFLQNGDGNIAAEEYQTQQNLFGFDLTLEQAQAVLDKVDTNRDGIVTYIGKMQLCKHFLISDYRHFKWFLIFFQNMVPQVLHLT